jgi:chromosome segregation ATPase
MSDEGVSEAAITAAEIITSITNELNAEKAINAALNNQIESIQSDDKETIQFLESQMEALRHRNAVLEAVKLGDEKSIEAFKNEIARYKATNTIQSEAIDRLLKQETDSNMVAAVDRRRLFEAQQEIGTLQAVVDSLREERDEYKIQFEALKKNRPNVEKHGETLRANKVLRDQCDDYRQQISDLNLENEGLRCNLRNIHNTVERNTKNV